MAIRSPVRVLRIPTLPSVARNDTEERSDKLEFVLQKGRFDPMKIESPRRSAFTFLHSLAVIRYSVSNAEYL